RLNDRFDSPDYYFQTMALNPGGITIGGFTIGDVNGDGKTDVTYVHAVQTIIPQNHFFGDATYNFAMDTYFFPNTTADIQNVAPIEQDGDGNMDLIYAYFTNPGYKIYTWLRSDETFYSYNLVEALILPGDFPDVTMPLDNPDTTRWMRAEVGGGDGNAP